MIHTDSNKHVMTGGETTVVGDTNTVATWDNRVPTVTYCSFTQSRQITSATLIEINSENRCHFMSWGDAAQASSDLITYSGNGTLIVDELTLDGSSNVISNLQLYNQSNGLGFSDSMMALAPAAFQPAEGFHYTETLGMGGTGNAITYPFGETTIFTIQ